MTAHNPLRLTWLLVLFVTGCAEPAQLGGLGVFNPNGFEGRMALATRVTQKRPNGDGAAQRVDSATASTAGQKP